MFGYSCGVINSFVLNKIWTFESKNDKLGTLKEFLRFAVINGVSLLLSVLGIKLFAESFGVPVLIAKIFATLIAQFVNYLGYKLWVFKK